MSVADSRIDFLYCRNGALLVRRADGDFSLSPLQLKILMHVYGEGATSDGPSTRRDLHRAMFGHGPLPRGRLPARSERRDTAKRSPSQRAALSRSLRRLHERGFISRFRTRIAPTAIGADLMAELRCSLGWKYWCKDWLRGDESASTTGEADGEGAQVPPPTS